MYEGIIPAEKDDFITELAREVLRGAELDDLQLLFADETRVCKLDEVQRHSPMGCPTEVSLVLVPVGPKTGGLGVGTPGGKSDQEGWEEKFCSTRAEFVQLACFVVMRLRRA